MATENDDDRDEGTEDSQDKSVSIAKYVLGRLMSQTGECIEYEDHGDIVVVSSDDLTQLRRLATIAKILDGREY